MRGLLILFICGFTVAVHAADVGSKEIRERALTAWKAGQTTNAISIVTEGLKTQGQDPLLWNFRAQMKALLGDRTGAIADLTEAIKLKPDSVFLYQERGMERFKAGQLKAAGEDFDEANRREPKYAPYNWQRGIVLYYLNRFAEGRKQFSEHRSVNGQDVENSVWEFLCAARAESLEAARKGYVEVSGDSRVPMAEIDDLFAGKGDVEDVLDAAENAPMSAQERQAARFYARLYLGLYADIQGQRDSARTHLQEAVRLATGEDYMGYVARVHLQHLSTAPAQP